MFRRLYSELVDEAAANILLHCFLRRSQPPLCRGPAPDALAGLYSGDLAAFYGSSPAAADLTADRTASLDLSGDNVWDCRFASDTCTPWPANDVVWCRHWPAPTDRRLAVVGVDGIVQLGSRWFRRLAGHLRPQGVDVVAVDTPGNFRRTPPGYRPGQLVFGGDLAHQLAITRQAVRDVSGVVAGLAESGRRVGLVGVSYGGWLALLTSLVAANVDFVVALAPPVDLVQMLRKCGTVTRGIRRGLGTSPLDFAEVKRLARPVIPSQWPAPLPPERIVLHAARFDRLVPSAGIEQLADLWRARLFVHDEAHFRFAVDSETPAMIARQVLDLFSYGA